MDNQITVSSEPGGLRVKMSLTTPMGDAMSVSFLLELENPTLSEIQAAACARGLELLSTLAAEVSQK